MGARRVPDRAVDGGCLCSSSLDQGDWECYERGLCDHLFNDVAPLPLVSPPLLPSPLLSSLLFSSPLFPSPSLSFSLSSSPPFSSPLFSSLLLSSPPLPSLPLSSL